jgi:hypothetical protein
LAGAHEPAADRTTDLAKAPKSVGKRVTTRCGLTYILNVGRPHRNIMLGGRCTVTAKSAIVLKALMRGGVTVLGTDRSASARLAWIAGFGPL